MTLRTSAKEGGFSYRFLQLWNRLRNLLRKYASDIIHFSDELKHSFLVKCFMKSRHAGKPK